MSNFKESFLSTLKRVTFKINKEGYPVIMMIAVFALLLALVSTFTGLIGLLFVIFSLYFFRDPERIQPDGDNLVLSVADGVVDKIEEVAPPEELGCDEKAGWIRISTFLSVFNVHVQRAPIDGSIIKLDYREGKFMNVAVDKYSKDNERQSCLLETKNGTKVAFVQIAGLIARRIVCNLTLNQEVKAGDRYGIIRFGSRVDVYVPKTAKIKVKVGQTMIGGESILAELE